MKPLRIGRIPWLVCAPYFHSMKNTPNWQLFDAPPSQLNSLLNQNELDIAPTSSFLYASNPKNYYIIPKISTSGPLEVESVALFCRKKYDSKSVFKLWSTPDSGTSVRLLKLLLVQHLNWNIVDHEDSQTADGCLWIGDSGLKARTQEKWIQILDLASLWKNWTGHPFVFGLWTVRKEIVENPASNKQLSEFISEVKKNVQTSIPTILKNWQKQFPLPCSFESAEQFLKTLDYQLDEKRHESLLYFYKLCFEQGWISQIPELRFWINKEEEA